MSNKLAYLPTVRRVVACVPSHITRAEDVLLVGLHDDLLSDIGGREGASVLLSLLDWPENGEPGGVWHNGSVHTGYLYFMLGGGVLVSDRERKNCDKSFTAGTYEVAGLVIRVCWSCERGECYPVPRSPASSPVLPSSGVIALPWRADANGKHILTDEMREALLMVGCDPESWQGDGWINNLHPEDSAIYVSGWDKAVRTGMPYANRGRFLLAGEWRYMTCTGKAIRNGEGRITGWEGIFQIEMARARRRA